MADQYLYLHFRAPERWVDREVAEEYERKARRALKGGAYENISSGHHGQDVYLLIFTEEPDDTWPELKAWLDDVDLTSRSRVERREKGEDTEEVIWDGSRPGE